MKQIHFQLLTLTIFIISIFSSCRDNIEPEIIKDPTMLPKVATNIITKINKTSATCGGSIPDSTDFQVTNRGVCWSENPNPTIDDNKSTDSIGSGKYISRITGLKENKRYFVRAYATNKLGTSYGDEISFLTASVEDACNNGYHTVKIGNQEWLVENLKTTKYNDGTLIPRLKDASVWATTETPGYGWYGNDSIKYGEIYGALYNWYSVNTGKLAPTGWHVATNDDWSKLIEYISKNKGNSETLSKALASKFYWNITGTNGSIGYNLSINNSSGFSALGGGYVNPFYYTYSDLNIAGYWWTPTGFTGSAIIYYAAHIQLVGNSSTIFTYFDRFDMFKPKMSGMSVKCIRDSN